MNIQKLARIAEKHLIEINRETNTPMDIISVLALMSQANLVKDVKEFIEFDEGEY